VAEARAKEHVNATPALGEENANEGRLSFVGLGGALSMLTVGTWVSTLKL
jgi:hypothetical protein